MQSSTSGKRVALAMLIICSIAVFFICMMVIESRSGQLWRQLPRPQPQYFAVNTSFTNLMNVAVHSSRVASVTNLKGDMKKYFSIGLQEKERSIYVEMLRRFDLACTHHKVTYMLYWGSALGSYRHHGIIPWDDEIDLWTPLEDAKRITEVVKSMGSNYKLNTEMGIRYKIFDTNYSQQAGAKSWRWPFLDICFYTGNSTHVWDTSVKSWNHPRSEVFPLLRRPFEGYWLNAPRQIAMFLKRHWNIENCCSRDFDHKREIYIQSTCQPCELLKPYFHFVHRDATHDDYFVETLMSGSRPLWNITLSN